MIIVELFLLFRWPVVFYTHINRLAIFHVKIYVFSCAFICYICCHIFVVDSHRFLQVWEILYPLYIGLLLCVNFPSSITFLSYPLIQYFSFPKLVKICVLKIIKLSTPLSSNLSCISNFLPIFLKFVFLFFFKLLNKTLEKPFFRHQP